MKKSLLLAIFALLLVSPGIISGQESEISKDWSIGVTAPFTNPLMSSVYGQGEVSYQFPLRYFGVSTSFKGITLNIYGFSTPEPNFYVEEIFFTGNVGYQYSFKKFKPEHDLNMIAGAYMGFDNLELAIGVESKRFIVMLSAANWHLIQAPEWYAETFHGFKELKYDPGYRTPSSLRFADPDRGKAVDLSLKVQYKF